MRTVKLPDGSPMPALGMGTWRFGEIARQREMEVDAIHAGLANGIRLIDTAEMYGEGGAEEVIGEALAGRRSEVFLVSKAYPHNADRAGLIAACERSLRRLRTDCIDLYLLHWRGRVPLGETVAGMQALVAAGKIRRWGVSNFDVADMADLAAVAGSAGCSTNQVLYNLADRGIEWQLLPEARRRGMPIMAYCPLGQGALAFDTATGEIAKRHGCSAAAIAVAWTLAQPGVASIPKSANPDRIAEIAKAAELQLTADDLAALDKAHPPPKRATPLVVI